jgi:hypothetical protein
MVIEVNNTSYGLKRESMELRWCALCQYVIVNLAVVVWRHRQTFTKTLMYFNMTNTPRPRKGPATRAVMLGACHVTLALAIAWVGSHTVRRDIPTQLTFRIHSKQRRVCRARRPTSACVSPRVRITPYSETSGDDHRPVRRGRERVVAQRLEDRRKHPPARVVVLHTTHAVTRPIPWEPLRMTACPDADSHRV